MSRQKLMALFLIPLACQLIYLGALSVAIAKANEDVDRHQRAERIIQKANVLSKVFYDAGAAMGGYSITKSPLFSDRFDKICRQVPESIDDLKKEVGPDTRQQQILHNISVVCETGLKVLGEAKGAIDDKQVDVAQFRARHMYKETRSLADRLQEELHGLTEDEQKVANEPANAELARRTVQYVLAAGVVMNLLIAGIGWFVVRKN